MWKAKSNPLDISNESNGHSITGDREGAYFLCSFLAEHQY